MYIFGLGIKADQTLAFKWGYAAANKGDALAQNLVGILYLNGWGVDQDDQQAIQWFKKSAEQKFNLAYQNLAASYEQGRGVTQDPAQALVWYERAAEGNNAFAMAKVSFFLKESDPGRSFTYIKRAAELGYVPAIQELGNRFYFGHYVPRDFSEAKKHYELASAKDPKASSFSLYMLGFIHFWGNGLPRDIDKGVELYKRAAGFGLAAALNELGNIYQNGIGVDEDEATAFKYYEQSAESGNKVGLVRAGIQLWNGVGVVRDPSRGRRYLEAGAKQGDLLAQMKLIDIARSEPSSVSLSTAYLKELWDAANEFNKKFPPSFNYSLARNSDFGKRAKLIFEQPTHEWKEGNLTWRQQPINDARRLVADINEFLQLRDSSNSSAELTDYLKILRLFVEKNFNFTLSSLSPGRIDEEEERRQDALLVEAESFSRYLEMHYGSSHRFYPWSLFIRINALAGRMISPPANLLEQISEAFKELSKPDVWAIALSDHTENLEGFCDYLGVYAVNQRFVGIALDLKLDENAARTQVASEIAHLENISNCLSREKYRFMREMIASVSFTRQGGDTALNAYLYENDVTNIKLQATLARKQHNYRKAERIMRTHYGEAVDGTPSIELIDYYLRDKEYEKIENALRRELGRVVTDSTGFSLRKFLIDTAKLPKVSVRQKIFLLKKSVELDRIVFLPLWNSDHPLYGKYDFLDRHTERNLVALLFEQRRSVEAELFLQLLKLEEVGDALRDSAIKNKFVVPDWYYDPEERSLNESYKRFLDTLSNKRSTDPQEQSDSKIHNRHDRDVSVFFDFLVSGISEERETRVERQVTLPKDRLGELMNSLPKGTALVQYVLGRNRLVINVNVRGKKFLKIVDLSNVALDMLVYRFRSSISSRSDEKEHGENLFNVLFRPIQQELVKLKIRHVMISPDNRLRYIPFSALWDGRSYLLERFTFSIYDDLGEVNASVSAVSQNRVVGFGVSSSVAGFSALPAVELELRSITQVNAPGSLPGKVFLNRDFTLKNFINALTEKYSIVHVATHFQFSPGTERNSFLLLGDGTRLTVGGLRQVSFKGVDLLTYSGCQTALGGGSDESGREILGLSFVSQENGARSVLSSLWSVSDKSTSELMSRMYRAKTVLKSRKSEALRTAKLEMLKLPQFSHPFHWAGFQLHGDWQ
jgi:CHAT domain-containing protein/TPR repeat protein